MNFRAVFFDTVYGFEVYSFKVLKRPKKTKTTVKELTQQNNFYQIVRITAEKLLRPCSRNPSCLRISWKKFESFLSTFTKN